MLKAVEVLLLLLAMLFLALHTLHLSADFPNHSPWMDWAKYTDEGWYGDAAIRHFQRGHWYVPGDFNPAAALPVWPVLEVALFHFTGANLIAARGLTVGIFAFILLCAYLLLRRLCIPSPAGKQPAFSLAPAFAVLLLAVSPFCYAFTRLAILEPLLILLTLLALLAASYAVPQQQGTVLSDPFSLRSTLHHVVPLVALGILLPLMVLTKTTAVFLFPAIFWLLWARAGYTVRPFLQLSLPALFLAAVTWLSYYGFIVHPHFLSDYRYLFEANAYTGITLTNSVSVLSETFIDGFWIGKFLYPLAILSAVLALLTSRRLLRNPLIPALLFWAFGYAAFLAYHDNLQPRYYLVIAVPLTLLVPVIIECLWNARRATTPLHRIAAFAAASVLTALTFTDARQTLHYVRTPDYTFTSAAARIHTIIAADPTQNPLVLSISGSNLSLMTGLPSICDDFGTMDLAVRIRAYHPGWYVAWNQVEDDKMDALSPIYHLHRVASFPVMDDPERNLLILYRLDPAPPTPPRLYHKRVIPRLLQTSFGQQPSQIQLQH